MEMFRILDVPGIGKMGSMDYATTTTVLSNDGGKTFGVPLYYTVETTLFLLFI